MPMTILFPQFLLVLFRVFLDIVSGGYFSMFAVNNSNNSKA